MKNEAENWLSMSEAAGHTPYSAEYLSLLARKKKLSSKKIGNAWYTTKPVLDDYMKKQMIRTQVQNGNFQSLEPLRSYQGDLNKHKIEIGENIVQPKVELIPVVQKIENLHQDLTRTLEKVIENKFPQRLPARPLSFRIIFSNRIIIAAGIILLIMMTLLPVPIVFGFLNKSFDAVKEAVQDSNTVLGFRPGTHENELLLLDSEGNIAIMGHVETGGQLKSFAAQGIAPIVVDSQTMVKNLNAEFIGGASSTNFTLAFVTANGSMTKEDVQLEGNVEVGKTLLVRGATKLLGTLEVGQNLKVFGEAEFRQALNVFGPAYFESLVTAQSDMVVAGNLDIRKNISLRGSLEAGSSIIARSGSFLYSSVSGDFSAGGKITLGNSDDTLTINSENVSINAAGDAIFDGSVSASSLSVSSFTTTNSTTTNATTTNLAVSGDLFTSLTTGSVPFIGTDGLLTQNNADLFWDNTNSRLGIGTSTPQSTLSLVQTVNGANIFNARRITDAAPSGDFIEYLNAAGDTTLFRVDNSGNLLAGGIINTGAQTITSISQPQFRVQYDASNEWTASTDSAGISTFGFNGTTPRAIWMPGSDRTDSFQFQNSTGLSVLSIDTLNQRVGVSTTSPWAKFSIGTHNLSQTLPSFVIASSSDTLATTTQFIVVNGNVGIGTTSPVALLHIDKASGEVTPRFQTGDASAVGIRFINTAAHWRAAIQDTSNFVIRDVTNLREPFTIEPGTPLGSGIYIDSTGFVGISTTSPGGLLSVSAAGTVPAFLLNQTSTGDLFTLQDSGSTVFTVKDGGNVGIGTTSPYAKLSVHVAATDSNTAILTIASSTATATSTLFTVLNSGNVGIGTSNPNFAAFNANDTVLSIYRRSTANAANLELTGTRSTDAAVGRIDFQNDDSGTIKRLAQINVLRDAANDAGAITFQTTPTTGSLTERLRITSNGNIGIGTTSPASLLSVHGTGYISSSFFVGGAITATSTLTLSALGTPAGTLLAADASGTLIATSTIDVANLTLAKGNFLVGDDAGAAQATSTIFISSTGDVGIGTTSPMEKFTVRGGSIFQAGGDAVTNYTPTTLGGVDLAVGVGQAGQGGRAIYVAGKYAYIVTSNIAGTGCSSADASGCEFRIYDISTSTPRFVGGKDIKNGSGNDLVVNGVFVSGGYAYVAVNNATGACTTTTDSNGCELRIYDVTNPTSPTLIGVFDNGTASGFSNNAVQVSGRYAYVLSIETAGFKIFDVSNPTDPVLVNTVDLGAAGRSLYVEGTRAYVTTSANSSGNEFRVYDVANPTNIVELGGMETGANTLSVYVSSPYAYVGKTNGGITEDFIIYDISNPSAIATTTAINVTSVFSIHLSGRYAYVGFTSVSGDDMRIYDVSDPYSILLVGGVEVSNNVTSAVVQGNRLFLGKSDAGIANDFIIYGITGIEAQSMLAHSFEAGNAAIRNNLVVSGDGQFSALNVDAGGIFSRGPLSVYTASSSATTSVATFIGGNVGIGTSTPFSTLQIASSSGAQLTLSDPSTLTNSHWSFRNAGGNFYLATSSASTFATSSTPALTIIGSTGNIGIGSTTPMERLTVTGGSIFQAGGDVVTNYTPTTLGGVEIGAAVGTLPSNPIFVAGQYAYIAVGTASASACSSSSEAGCEFRIYDVSTSTPSFVGGFDTGAVFSVSVSGNVAYVGLSAASSTSGELLLYDISNPKNLVLLSSVEIGTNINTIQISGRYAYLAHGNTTQDFRIVDISDPKNPVVSGGVDGLGIVNGAAVSGRYAYVVTNGIAGNEFHVIDISNPKSPTVVGGMDLGTSVHSVAISGRYAYVGKVPGGVTEDFIIYDVADPAAIATTTGIDLPNNVSSIQVAGRYAYIGMQSTAGNDFRILDVLDPYNIVTVGGVDVSTNINDVFVSGRRAYIGLPAAATNEFRVLDLTGIETQSLLAHSFEAGQAAVRSSLTVGQGLYTTSLNVGLGGIGSYGPLSVMAASTTATDPISASFMGGSVGVGTTSPWRTFSVVGTMAINGVTNTTASNSLCLDGTTWDVTRQASNSCLPSSIRYKHNVLDSSVGLAALRQLRPVSFEYNEDKNLPGVRLGLVAEEVALVDPRLVVYNADGLPETLDDFALISASIKAIQDLDLNLAAIASTTATTTSDSQSFAESFFANLFARVITWLADSGNGIQTVFAKTISSEVVYTKELCIEDVCVTKTELVALLELANQSVGGQVYALSEEPVEELTTNNPQPTTESKITEPMAITSEETIIEESPTATSSPEISTDDTESAITEPAATTSEETIIEEPVTEESLTEEEVAEEESVPEPEPVP